MKVKVIGAGLAGSEAAWQLAQRGIEVELYEMRPHKKSPACRKGKFRPFLGLSWLSGQGRGRMGHETDDKTMKTPGRCPVFLISEVPPEFP